MLDTVGIYVSFGHDIRIDIYQKHTKSDRYKKQRLKTFSDCQIQEDTGYKDHNVVSYTQIHKRSLR